MRGFSLVELMIAVAVVGILAMIAYPAYTDQMRKTRRADAKAGLLELAQFMERVFLENKTYRPGGADPALPFAETPKDSGTKFYDLAITASTATTFTLSATPKGAQASDPCGTLGVTNAGAKSVSASTVALCW